MIYVIKENRTFDQEFGSLGQGNGDPSLNLFGDESAPNARALAKQFVTLDNFYSDAEVSADGWNWATGALANSYVQHAWPQNYGGQNRPYDFEGGNLATSPGTDPTDAFIWNKLSDAGISYRNYGFRVFGGQYDASGKLVGATVAGNPSTEPRLLANTDLNYAGYDLTKPDSIPDLITTGVNQPTRIAEWLKEFNQYETNGNLPTVEFVRLPNDHTNTDTPGTPTPRAYVADNDYALGQLVQAVSQSKDWGSTAIFVIEDDAQEGPDHVDAHRTVAQVISPYTQTGKVDSTFYSQVSVLRTVEQIVGLAPMTQFDAAATPMLNSFTDTPNMKTYTAIVPTQNVQETNPVAGPHFSMYASLADVGDRRQPERVAGELGPLGERPRLRQPDARTEVGPPPGRPGDPRRLRFARSERLGEPSPDRTKGNECRGGQPTAAPFSAHGPDVPTRHTTGVGRQIGALPDPGPLVPDRVADQGVVPGDTIPGAGRGCAGRRQHNTSDIL